MPGAQVANWQKYHALRRRGMSKTASARIANSGRTGSRRGGGRPSGKRKR